MSNSMKKKLFCINDSQTVELRLKIIVVGEVAAGKTSFIERYVNNKFIKAYKPTVGVDFGMKTMQWDYTTKVKLQLWDCAGSEQYMTRIYYKNAVGALVLFDLNCRKSFAQVVKWKKQIDDKVMLPNCKPIPCVLIGNKCDVEPDSVKSMPSLGQFCEENNFRGYYLTSAKEGINVNESLHFLVEQIVNEKELTEHLLRKKTMSSEIIVDKKSIITRGCC